MLRPVLLTVPVLRDFMIALTPFIILSLTILPLTGCNDGGQGGPSISSLSTPTDTTLAETTETEQDEDDPTIAATSIETEPLPNEVAEEDPELLITSLEGEELPMTSSPFAPTEATARLTWAVHPDPSVTGYRVYYGKESSGELGSCSYETSQSVEAPPAIITGLEPNTPYFFAISAYENEDGESESPCSNEVLMISSPAQG